MNFNIFGGFSENEYFLGDMKILWIFYGGHHKIGLYLGVISMHLASFLKVKLQYGGIYLGCKNFKKKIGVPEIPDTFLCER